MDWFVPSILTEEEVSVKYYSYAIGRDLTKCRNVFLYAPDGYLLEVGDVVTTDDGTYRIMFSRHHANMEFPEVMAMMIALDMRPIKIKKKLTEIVFDWKEDDANDDVDR